MDPRRGPRLHPAHAEAERPEAEAAAERTEAAWQTNSAGRQLLASTKVDLRVTSDGFSAKAALAIREWQTDVLSLVSSEGKSKKSTARYLALGVNGVGVALMIVVFTQTGGLTGAEVGAGAELLDDHAAAALLDVSPGTLSVWRSTGRYNLPFLKIGKGRL